MWRRLSKLFTFLTPLLALIALTVYYVTVEAWYFVVFNILVGGKYIIMPRYWQIRDWLITRDRNINAPPAP